VLETERTWDYLEPSESKYRPVLVGTDTGREKYWMIDGHIAGARIPTLTEKEMVAQSLRTGRLITAAHEASSLDDVDLRLAGMDALGIDLQVLHNTLWIQPVSRDVQIETALCRSWNRWMADMFREGRDRLYWSCVVPIANVDAAREEMRFAREHGAVAVCVRPIEPGGLMVDPSFYPIYEAAADLDLAVAVHIANGDEGFYRLLASRHVAYGGWGPFRVPAVIAAHAIIASELHTLFPTVRWGIIEASASWVPWLCVEYRRRLSLAPDEPANPFADNNIYVTAQVNDDIPYIVRHVGEEVLLIGTDYGHTDASSEFDALMKLRQLEGVSAGAKRGMLSTNPARLYGLSAAVPEEVG
jgi:predicted TIM-barrel fold metal-dependent hydrolase